ncbi:MAG: hypothetical protein SVV03_01165 [Candidatus Nanohaloarchaea archaeon]|nr:hypothetical protein [Candidatus Nanohaloarchaea archaeon]
MEEAEVVHKKKVERDLSKEDMDEKYNRALKRFGKKLDLLFG